MLVRGFWGGLVECGLCLTFQEWLWGGGVVGEGMGTLFVLCVRKGVLCGEIRDGE